MAQTLDNLDININVDVRGLPEITTAQRRVASFGNQVNQTSVALRRNAGQFNATAVATNKFAKGALQQAGFQVGDFAVQLANGTSGAQAFGQQGSQLLGIFGPVGAVLGAAVAIMSAFAVAAEKTAKTTKDVTEQGKKLLETYQNIEQLDFSNLTKSATDALREFQPIIDFMQEERMRELTEQLQNVREGISSASQETADDAGKTIERLQAQLGSLRSDFQGITREETEATRELIRQSELRSDAITTANIFNRIQGNTREELVRSIQTAYQQLTAFDLINEETTATLTNLLNSVDATAVLTGEANRAGAEVEEAERASSDMADELERAARAVMNINTSAFTKLQELQAELRGRTRGLTDEQIRIQQAAVRAEQAAREAGVDNAAELAQIAAEAAQTERQIIAAESALEEFGETGSKSAEEVKKAVTQAQTSLQGVEKFIGGPMERAFMSMVEGTQSTKDAFRMMARDIIAELYRVFVVQQIVGMVSSAVGGFFNLNQVSGPSMPLGTGNRVPIPNPSYAGGGYTGMGSRSGGIDGKGGFAAILHPNETVIDHNRRGGGGQPVIINQTINVSTGVQQTVRTEIKQLMPQIAESAKQAVVDAKRRGGSYGRAFA